MNRRQFIKSTVFSAAALTLPGCSTGSSGFTKAGNQKPNFLFILADDYGWSQLGCYGSQYYETPFIDGLASEGMKFTDAYAACPVCSPTRASIMTGKYPARLHLTDFIAGGRFPYDKYKQPDWQKFLPLEEITFAEVLKTAGYKTASFGKWHLSIDKKPPKSLPYNPDKQGFDEYFVTYKPSSKDDPESDAHNVENTIHSPILAKKKLLDKYKNKPGTNLPQNNPIVAAMIEDLDNSVGSLLAKLDELDIADKTIVVFFGDNGGLEKSAKQTPLRSGKANLYEGGIREPLIVRWPGVVQQGSTCSEPVTSVDFSPTFLDILDLKNKAPNSIDGLSLLPLLLQTGTLNREAIYWHYPHYHSSSIGPGGAVRMGDYKLLEWFDETIPGPANRFELYNLKHDISEQNNLSKKMPRKTEQLKKLLASWRKKVGAQNMTPNPNYDPQRAKKSKS
jgi:uncharacterized sulfatase